MRQTLHWGLLIGGCTACDYAVVVPDVPDPQPPIEFGTITVQVDSRRWFVLPGPDSVVAYFDPQIVQLMVQATGQGPLGSGRLLSMRICSMPTVQGYSFAAPGLSVAATWMTYGEAKRPRGGRIPTQAVYSSIGRPADSLVIEEIDWASRHIRGRFSFHAEPDPYFYPTGRGLRTLAGYFSGRVGWRYLTPCRP